MSDLVINKWPLEKWGRVRVMLFLLEQTGFLSTRWEYKEDNFKLMPEILKKYQKDNNYPLNVILDNVPRKTVVARLSYCLTGMIKALKCSKKNVLIPHLCEDERQSIINEIVMLQDRVDYAKESMRKLRRQNDIFTDR